MKPITLSEAKSQVRSMIAAPRNLYQHEPECLKIVLAVLDTYQDIIYKLCHATALSKEEENLIKEFI